jgi:PAS domain S-box-containing protein
MSIRTKLILILVSIAVVPMLFVGTLGYYSGRQALETARIAALSGICDLKVKKIEDFFQERKKELSALQAYPEFKKVVGLLAESPSEDPEGVHPAPLNDLKLLLNNLQTAYHFTSAKIATADGRLIYALGDTKPFDEKAPLGDAPGTGAAAPGPAEFRISEIYLTGQTCNPVAVQVAAPIRGLNRRPAGWLSFEYDFTPIYASLQDATSLGRTGEVLIAKKNHHDVVLLQNFLGDDPGATMNREIRYREGHGAAIQAALSGRSGHGATMDYRGRKVIAAWRHVPLLDWGMVVKVDAVEAYAPATKLRNFFLLLMIAVVLLCICVAAIVAGSFLRPIHLLQKSVGEIGKGNLDHKVGTVSSDEIGQLGRAFDRMTGKLKSVTASREQLNHEIGHRRQVEEDLKETIRRLDDRVRELNCFFEISRLFERRGQSPGAVLQGIVDLIPAAMQNPTTACAKLTLNGKVFESARCKPSPWQLVFEIGVNEDIVGHLTVGYLERKSDQDEDPFIPEERSLLEAIAERVGKIIERQEALIALEESEKRFRDLVENSLTGISIVQHNRVIYQNREQERILGPLPRPYILTDLQKIHPDDVAKVSTFIQNLGNSAGRSIETDFRYFPGRDGSAEAKDMIWVNCRGISINYRGEPAILVNIVDMTRAKELEKLLSIQDKMASLGRVAAGIAHEIRNPLSGINIYLDTLKKLHHREGSEEKVENILRQLNGASRKIESVIRRVMDFAKPSEPRLAKIDINEPVGEAISLTAVTMRKSGILLIKSLSDNLPAVYADRHLIEEMVLNLINNAAEAMRNSDADKIVEVATAFHSGGVDIVVSDSGPGIPSSIKDKIFDPYLTTKSEGTGIGLSLCHRIITDHGGTLTAADSELGGAEFRATIPIKRHR